MTKHILGIMCLGLMASASAQLNLNIPTVWGGSFFQQGKHTYVTIGTDVGNIWHRGRASLDIQAFTGIDTVSGLGVIGSALPLSYSPASNVDLFIGPGLPVPYNKITLSDFTARKIGFTAGAIIKFTISASAPKSASVLHIISE